MTITDRGAGDGMQRGRKRRASRTREHVLDGVRRVLARRGLEATRFADVIAETGTALSTLQYSFGNREDLIIAALREANGQEVARVNAAMRGVGEPTARLRVFVKETMRAGASLPEAREGWLVWVEYWRAAARDSDLAIEWRAAYEEWRGLVRPILQDGVARGDFSPPADLEAVITVILALLDGLSIPMVLDQGGVVPDRASNFALATIASVLRNPGLAAT